MNQNQNVAIRGITKEIYEGCLSCGKNITHPLCPDCIAKGYFEWIKKFPKEEQELKNKTINFLKAHRFLDGKSKTCVACNKNNTHICPYCFTEYLYKLTRQAGLGVRALTEFLFIFNFDFEHKGYFHDLEVLGGY